MDFLKSAVASAISKGPPFPYSFGDRVDIDQSIWALHNGTKREDGSKCSIFSFDVSANKSRLPLAKNALRKLRTLRHPGVIKVLDTVETDTYIYIATERLTPLSWQIKRRSLAEETLKWGLHSIAKTIKFINEEATSVHGCIRISSVFTSESGEWKLGGFDILSSVKEDDAIIYTHGSLVPDSGRYAPPEIAKTGWEAVKRNPTHAVDAYNFGILITEAFNGSFSGIEQVAQTKNIPPTMHQSYKRLVNASPKVRLSVGQFLDQGRRNGGFFQTPLIQITEDVENLGLKEDAERDEFLGRLDELSDDFPEDFFKMKVLPELLKSVEFGGGGPKVLNVVIKISSKLSDEEYDIQITPVVVRLFANPDRAIRVCLLDNLHLMIDHFSQKIVNDKIFPQLATGFSDSAPILREQTVKSVLVVISKLSERTINGDLLRQLAKTANDEQPGIRTNTTICLGKIARNLGASNRTKVLTAAFSRSLRDPFVHARNAALLALAATVDLYNEDDCATKLLPAMCPSLVDKEKLVRDQANKTIEIYLHRIHKYQEDLPETILPPPNSNPSSNTAAPRMSAPQNESSWAGWAISSFTNKLAAATGEISSDANNGKSQDPQRPSSVPPNNVTTKPTSLTVNSKSTIKSQKSSNPFATASLSSTPLTSTPAAADPDDVDDNAWGDPFDDAPQKDEHAAESFDPFAPAPSSATTQSTAFDDKGEPDFAGWLAAQAQTKQKSKPLPKGLTKTTRPGVGAKANSTSAIAGRTSAAKKTLPTKKKVEETKKKEEVEDDGEDWGDAWA